MPTSARVHRPAPPARAVLRLVMVPSVAVAVSMATLYLVVLPLVPAVSRYYFPESTATYATYRVAILGHILFGSVALVLGPVNLWLTLRRRRAARRRHRRIGAGYAVAVAAAGTFGLFMAFHAYPGTMPFGRPIVTSGMATLATVWLGTLALAVRAGVRRDLDRHAFWMIVNVSATYSAVWFRVLNGVAVASGHFQQVYPVLGWAGWVPSVAVGVVLARRAARRVAPTAATVAVAR